MNVLSLPFCVTMKKTSTLLAFLLLLVLKIPSLSFADFEYDSVEAGFLRCLKTENNIPQDRISNIVYTPASHSYTSVLDDYIRNARFKTSKTPKPLIIIAPEQESHVQATIICVKKIGIQLKIRSGGHDFEGISYISDTPFFILDMFKFRNITVDVEKQSAFVQVGATIGELYYSIWQKSEVHGFPAGVCPTVGIGGHFSGAGYGTLLRKYGLSVDNIFDAQIVDVSGRILDKKSMGEDLFWAIKGGGGASFGVVLSYSITLVSVPETVTVFRVDRTLEEGATDLVYKWQFVAPSIDNNLLMNLQLHTANAKTRLVQNTVRASITALYLGSADDVVTLLDKEFPELALKKENCTETNWIGSELLWTGHNKSIFPEVLLNRNLGSTNFMKRKSDYVQTTISKENLGWIWKKMIEQRSVSLLFIPYGGRMDKIPASETPFPHRKGNLFKIHYSVNWHKGGADIEEMYLGQIRKMHSYMTPFVSKNPRSAYLNYRDLDIGVMPEGGDDYKEGRVYGEKYFGVNFDRLVKVKTAVDPENFFRNEQSIPTSPRHKNRASIIQTQHRNAR